MTQKAPVSLPHSLEAEQAFLGMVFLDSDRTISAALENGLRSNDFYRSGHQKIFEAMFSLYEKGQPVELVTLPGALNGNLDKVGGPAYLAELADCAGTAVNAGHYVKAIQDKARLRRLIDCGRQIVETSQTGTDASEALETAERLIYSLRDSHDRSRLTRLDGASLREAIRVIEARATGQVPPGIPTGFSDLDRLTGGFRPSELIILAGRPSMGKTALALSLAVNAAIPTERDRDKHGPAYPTAFFSLEMSGEQLKERLLSMLSGVPLQKLRIGHDLTNGDFEVLTKASARLTESPIYLDDSAAQTVTEIRAKARRLKSQLRPQGQDLGLVVVDYLQLMRGEGKNREQEIGGISRGLKGLAKELEVPVLALSQLNRALEARNDKRPGLADLRESGAIEQDADLVAFVYREEVYSSKAENIGRGELLVKKHRQGPTGEVDLTFQKATVRFRSGAR